MIDSTSSPSPSPSSPDKPSAPGSRSDFYGLACEAVGHLISRDLEDRRWRRVKRALFIGAIALGFGTWVALYAPMLGWSFGPAEKSVGVIPIVGTIGSGPSGSADALVPVIESACKSPLIETVVLRVSSPGGSPAEAERIAGALESCRSGKDGVRKPVIAVIETVGASAAYLIAMHADEVVASRYALVGSIGAVIRSFDASEALERYGVKERVYASGGLKSSNSPWSSNTPDQDALNQALVEDVGNVFKAEVMAARGSKLKPTADMFSGRAWLGGEAKALGLVDSIGTFEQLKATRFKSLHVHQFRPRQTLQDKMGLQAVAREFGSGLASGLSNGGFE